jgi:hypothetical protein
MLCSPCSERTKIMDLTPYGSGLVCSGIESDAPNEIELAITMMALQIETDDLLDLVIGLVQDGTLALIRRFKRET